MFRSFVLGVRITRPVRCGVLSAVCGAVLVGSFTTAAAQLAPPDTVLVRGASSVEEGYLSFLNLNRDSLGPRSSAMGGTGITGTGGVESLALNPASLVDVVRWELASEWSVISGSGQVFSFPSRLDLGEDQALETSDYRVSPGFRSGYRGLTLGVPLVLLGNRGALGVSYRRMSPGFTGDETRFSAVGPITNDIPAIIGVDQSPEGGHDAITVAVAREMATFLDLGMNLNFQSGEISRDLKIGASVFGQRVTSSESSFSQDIEGMNLDVGGRLHLGSLTLGGSVFLGHDLTFRESKITSRPLADIQNPENTNFVIETVVPEHTQSIPTILGVGASYRLGSRLTVNADLWHRPWSKSEITREAQDPLWFFVPDAVDSTQYQFIFAGATPQDGDESFSARLEDDTSIRFGLEFLLTKSERSSTPVRLGFRKEKLTRTNVAIPDEFSNYVQLVDDVYRYTVLGVTPPEGVDPAALVDDLNEILEFKEFVFRGSPIEATTFSFGLGFHLDNLAIDLGLERTQYDLDRFFFQPFNSQTNPFASITREDRSITQFTVATRMTF